MKETKAVGEKPASLVSWKVEAVGPGKTGEGVLPGKALSCCWKQTKSKFKRGALSSMESS